ncbi:MAG: hypothetical protein GYA42_07550 [Syntrophomonadaceae bacterium]|nr:hypothetical protein [Syntrophomonadaceae bacterium]
MTEKMNQQFISNVQRTINEVDGFMASCWNMWQISLNNLCTSSQQVEKMTQDYVDHHNKVIAEGNKTIAQMVQITQDAQKHMIEIVKDAAKTDLWKVDAFDSPMVNYWAEIGRKYKTYLQNINKVA